ncbi:hypothetical protein FACS1894141_3530 [Spirochaetia bacterium]|nr:hypothetical protein FACS1894141_3530 [Spirochaetia bacterium]
MKKALHILAIIAAGAMVMAATGCASTKYALDGAAYESVPAPYAEIVFWHSVAYDLARYAYPVSVEGHELPKIKTAGKDFVEFRIPSSDLPLKMKVRVYTKFKTGLDLAALASNALKGRNNIDEEVELEIPAPVAGKDGDLYRFEYLETEGLVGGDLSALSDLAGDGSSLQEALFGKQFWILYIIRGQSEPPVPGAVKLPYRNTLVKYVVWAKSF